MKLSDINYAALENQDLWKKAVRDRFKIPDTLFWILCAFAGIAIMLITKQPGVVILPTMIFATMITATVQKYKRDQWKQFAEDNGWGITPGELATIQFVPPSIMDRGHARSLSDVVHADVDGHLCSVFMYQFTIGSGKSSQTHFYTIARVLLPKTFPHLILDSKQSRAIRDKDGADVSVKLEGDFNKYFRLSHAKDEHIDALSIITPDIMQTLIDSNAYQDIEIADNSVYFMAYSDHRSAEQLPQLLASVDALSDELMHKAKTLRYSTTTAPVVHLTQAATDYFASGERVVNSLWFVLFTVFLLIPLAVITLIGLVTSLQSR